MSTAPRGSDAAAASSSEPEGVAAWWPPRPGALNALGLQVRQNFNRLVFQIDAEQEARMRAYLDQTYGDSFEEGRRGKDRPIQMDSLRCVAGARELLGPGPLAVRLSLTLARAAAGRRSRWSASCRRLPAWTRRLRAGCTSS